MKGRIMERRELILKEMENVPESYLREILNFLQFWELIPPSKRWRCQ